MSIEIDMFLFQFLKELAEVKITLWKLMLSSKGTAAPSLVLFLSQVMVFRQTGNKMRAMFNLSVSAAPFAMHTQCPITS